MKRDKEVALNQAVILANGNLDGKTTVDIAKQFERFLTSEDHERALREVIQERDQLLQLFKDAGIDVFVDRGGNYQLQSSDRLADPEE